MGALCGYVGSQAGDKPIVSLMAAKLAHRGTSNVAKNVWANGQIAYRPQYSSLPKLKTAAGILVDGDLSICVCGFVLDKNGLPQTKEALLSGYRAHGIGWVSKLRGSFVAVVADGKDTYLIRDASGVRTLYYSSFEGRVYFAVEPKGILAVPGMPRRIRPASLAQYLTFSFIPGSNTMLEDIFEVPAGHYVHIDSKLRAHTKRYFFFEKNEFNPDAPDTDESEWVARFSSAFSNAVSETLPDKEECGVFLSGGIDSSVVVAELAKRTTTPLKTYAIHFGRNYPNELDFARAVADHCKTDHTEFEVQPKNFLPRLRKIIWHLDDPIGDPITVPNFAIAERASQDVRWVYNGEGGDPCFGGPKNIFMMLHHWYGGIERGENFREKMYLSSYRRGYEEIPRLLSPEILSDIDEKRDLESVLTPFFNTDAPRSFLNKLMAINIQLKGSHLILPKVDRMMGAWRLTPFAPLFDPRILELSFAMPGTMKVRSGIEKWVLKRAFENQLPQSIIERPKSGMRVPVHFWFKKEMRRYAKDILSPRNVKRAGLFNPDRVAQILKYDTVEGPGRYGLRLWMLVTLEMWRRIVVEGESL